MSKNKTGRYFKYAIGEVILVVIGILIALQINNWSENRKSQNAKTQYCKQLLDEIKLDISTINASLVRLEGAIKAYKNYEAIYETSNLSLDAIYNNMKKLPRSAGLISSFNTKTIEVLKSTGDIKLLPNYIQTLLITLENEQSAYRVYGDNNYSMFLSLINETYLVNSLSIESKLSNQKPFTEALDFKKKFPDQLAKHHLLFSTKHFADNTAAKELNDILSVLNKVTVLIEQELKH